MNKRLSKVIVSCLIAIMLLSIIPMLSACKDDKKTYTIQFKVAHSISPLNNSVI